MLRKTVCLCMILGELVFARVATADGQISAGAFDSRLLGRSYQYLTYLPEGYDESCKEYPVVYLLHGSFGNQRDWARKGNVKATLDRLIRAGSIPPVVAIMPGSQSWWIDGHNEPAATSFLEELIPHIEDTYRVVPERHWRGVAGLSAGGYGAVSFALSQPDMFGAAAAFSPASYDPLPPDNSSAWHHPAFARDGNFDRELWARSNYTAHLENYRAQDNVVPLYISAGDRDAYKAAEYASELEASLILHQAESLEREIFPGGHTWRVWRASLPQGLTFMFRYLREPESAECSQASWQSGRGRG